MKTYWVRLYADEDVEFPWVDAFITGTSGDRKVVCFAIRADSEADIYDLLLEKLPAETSEVDFINEKEWRTYRDFAGSDSRFQMTEKYLDEPIDTVAIVRART